MECEAMHPLLATSLIVSSKKKYWIHVLNGESIIRYHPLPYERRRTEWKRGIDYLTMFNSIDTLTMFNSNRHPLDLSVESLLKTRSTAPHLLECDAPGEEKG